MTCWGQAELELGAPGAQQLQVPEAQLGGLGVHPLGQHPREQCRDLEWGAAGELAPPPELRPAGAYPRGMLLSGVGKGISSLASASKA